MRTYYIYKTTNTLTGKSYIGQHELPLIKEAFNRYLGSGVAIKSAIKKYGRENFTKEILEYIEDDDKHEKVSERERYWIEKENTTSPNGYNISPGGEGGITSEIAKRSAETRKANGYKMPDEVKIKISNSHKNKKLTEEHRRHLSESHHLRTLHKILHEDGTIEETYLSLGNIAKQYGTTQNTLLRRSANKKFINGIYLLDINPDEYECCSYKNSKTKGQVMCIDPVFGDTCTFSALHNRKYRNKEKYKGININNCIIGENRNAV